MNIMSKLTSRKLWMAVAGLVVGILVLFKVDANTTTQISGVIMSLGSVIAYIVGEGLVDASAASLPDVSDSEASEPADAAEDKSSDNPPASPVVTPSEPETAPESAPTEVTPKAE